jgi:hypothetical protein
MGTVFSFFLRLFLCFVAAKFLLHAIGVAGREYLVGLTILFLINVYVFSYLVFRDQAAPPAREDHSSPPSSADPAPEVQETPEAPAPPEP